MTRNQSRGVSRRRNAIEALSPCTRYSTSMGVNPFSSLLQSAGIGTKVNNEVITEEEKKRNHKTKMASEQKSAKARKERKRNKTI